MSIFDKLQKRAFYPFKMVNGETVHLCGLTFKQLRTLEPFKDTDESNGYAIGCCLLNEDGSRVFTQEPGESPQDFGQRVLTRLDDGDGFSFDLFNPIVERILKLSHRPSEHAAEAIVKN